jgi:hypothetical protein
VPSGSVTGRAEAAVGDSGIFASPVVPRDVRPVVAHADAESVAVALAYSEHQDLARPDYHKIPTERRQFCGRSFYVRPVVAMPDTLVVRPDNSSAWMWGGAWVMPVCDDTRLVRTTVFLVDVAPGLRVIQGPGPRDVPTLVPDSGTFPHIGDTGPWQKLDDLERGIAMTPETAVAVATSLLATTTTHARVAEVPKAFTAILALDRGVIMRIQPSSLTGSQSVFAQAPECPRWRLTLDRTVTLRGNASGRIVRTQTVYVIRGPTGCGGDPRLQIPRPAQPPTVPVHYIVWQHRKPPMPGTRYAGPPPIGLRIAILDVLEPIWFEDARVEP